MTLKKDYIKPKKVRDWFEKKKKRAMRALLLLGRLALSIIYLNLSYAFLKGKFTLSRSF